MIFKSLDGSFRCVDPMFVGRNELPFNILRLEILSDGRRCFVVENVEARFKPFTFKVGENIIEGVNNCLGFPIGDSADDDGVCRVVVHHEDVLFVF